MNRDLHRTSFDFKFSEAPSGAIVGSFAGYGAVFGNVDSYGDVIQPGAFAGSLARRKMENRPLPPLYYMHGQAGGHPNEPIGVFDVMREDANGLWCEGRIAGLDPGMETEKGKWILSLLRNGAISGMSIGYFVRPGGSAKADGKNGAVRLLTDVEVVEVSLVDTPANPSALVTRVKGEARDSIGTIREFEKFLRDVGGWSAKEAKVIASGGFKSLASDRDGASAGNEVVKDIERAARALFG